MFGLNLLEGQQLANCYRPEISLYEDDPATLGVIFSVLHYQKPEEMSEMTTMWLATLAIHCDKYDCTKALWPRASMWLFQLQKKDLTPEDHGNLLLTAYLFRNSQIFTEVTREAQLRLSVRFSIRWEKSGILNRLPGTVILELRERIENLLDSMQYEIHSIAESLRNQKTAHAIQAQECKRLQNIAILCCFTEGFDLAIFKAISDAFRR
ncbi:hypothetical protein N7486_008320 [Penicillium sp. IBT 16267x]|nr:hypothetical protein N7486_008320 [Penicillium sp. IBT 16267x]